MDTERVGGVDIYQDRPKVIYEWKGESMVFEKKSKDFYSTVIVFASIFALVLFFIEGLIPVLLVGAVVFFIFVTMRRDPEIVENKIREDGIISAGKSYPWNEVDSYWIENRAGRDMIRVMVRNWPWHLVLVLPKDAKGIDVLHVRKTMDEHARMVVPTPTGTDRFIEWFRKRFPFE